ncbi:MAG: DNA topoisomerase 3 [Desulfovibrionaceae bacterium]|nr:DNA topoisomerase 3 [Desulfovibrionaceae bacterium]
MRVFVAEKPSLAKTIAESLGHPRRNNGFFSCDNGDIVTWCFGHLLELAQPEDYDPAWGNRYNRAILPINPGQTKLIPKDDPGVREQLKVIGQLIAKTPLVVNAGDPDREGQLLVDEVLEYLNYQGQTQRIFLPALDPKTVAKGLAHLEDNSKYRTWRDAAATRRHLDWLGGINMSRAMTIFGHSIGLDGVLSLGRVQTPTLRIVVDRERQIANFVPVDYAQLQASIKHNNGTFKATFKPGEDTLGLDPDGRLIDFEVANSIKESSANLPGKITSLEKKNVKVPPKLPYALAQLQEDCGAKFSLGAQQVLDIAQKLYEAKLTTYPRTDCEYLPEEQFDSAPEILRMLTQIPDLNEAASMANPTLKSKAWDTSKITAHHAIIPTGIPPKNLSKQEEQVYNLIALRYILQFWPAQEYEATKVKVVLDNGTLWEAQGKVIKNPGWTKIVRPEKEEEPPLPAMKKNDPVNSTTVDLIKKRTTPPAHFTEGTLIKAMKAIHRFVQDKAAQAKLRETSGLGTEATRAGILETLKKRGYLINKGKTLLPTTKGENVVDLCPDSMKDIVTTAILEDVLTDVQAGKINPGEAVATYVNDLGPMIDAVFAADLSKITQKFEYTHCPKCQRAITKIKSKKNDKTYWICQNPDCHALFNDDQGQIGQEIMRSEISSKYKCPKCGQPLARRQRRDGQGFFWACTGYPECKWTAPDDNQKPGQRQTVKPPIEGNFCCPLCGTKLVYGISKNTGNPYWACFNPAPEHGSKTKFFPILPNGAPEIGFLPKNRPHEVLENINSRVADPLPKDAAS